MSAATKTVVVASDALTYVIPGQKDPVFPATYPTAAAKRGDQIDIRAEDYDRFRTLGAVVDPDTREAGVAQSGEMRWGDPAGAVKISREAGNTPEQKLMIEARGRGLLPDTADDPRAQDPDAVSGAIPADVDTSDEKKLNRLNGAQLKALAAREGVEVDTGDSKQKIAKNIAAHSKSRGNG